MCTVCMYIVFEMKSDAREVPIASWNGLEAPEQQSDEGGWYE